MNKKLFYIIFLINFVLTYFFTTKFTDIAANNTCMRIVYALGISLMVAYTGAKTRKDKE